MLISSSPQSVSFKVITLNSVSGRLRMSTSFHSFSEVTSHSFTWNTFLCLVLPNSVFISVESVSSSPNLGGEPVLPMSCGPSTLPSGHRALCSRLSLRGLCAPFSCGKTDYCRSAGRWGWPLAHLVLRLCLVQ